MKPRGANSLQLSLIYIITLLHPFFLISETTAAHEDCPWYQNDSEVPDEVKSHCICATNPSSNNQLSIQCQEVDAQQLVSTLLEYEAGTNQPLELLYLNGSRITDSNGMVPARLFGDLKVISLQLSSCGIKSIHPETFLGLENHIKHLSLSQNYMTQVSTASFEKLHRLALLDLSYNKITRISEGAFEKLTNLNTLKLNDNNLELDSHSFKGLETALRNLNLKGTRISSIPDAISNLSSLAFLDLAQNRLRDLESLQFLRLHSLTALNLERNLLQTLPDTVFHGVNDTLSSLSLLNNLITHFPKEALHTLKELRVLDLGFNLLTEIPSDAFDGLTSLTLLALDGNPLASLSEDAFSSLNTTLKGISLGGRFLNCDCRIRWISEWIREYDLQVTSRERNPQFCGSPPSLKMLNFYQIKSNDLQCNSNVTSPQADYDVNLSPEDIALLGLGSSPLFVSQPGHQSEENNASEQETDENKTTFVLESPQIKQRNFTRPRQRFRRPKPTKPSLSDRVPTKILNEDKVVSQENESQENNGGEENSSMDLSLLESPANNRTTSNISMSTLKSGSTTKPPTSTATFTTRKIPQAIRPHNIRTKITPKTTYTTITSTISNTGSSTRTTESEVTRPPSTKSTSNPPKTFTAANPGQPKERKHASKTIDAIDIDDSKIPVISGVGSSLSNSNLNTGNIMAMKPPTSVQTQGGIAVKPQSSVNAPPSSASHQGPQAVRPMTPNLIFAEKSDILLREVDRSGDSVLLQWESSKHSSGFRIIFRLFGEDTFRHGPPLAATEREYRIKNIPHNECLVVCVVPYDDILYNEINPSASSVPPGSQCREVKPDSPSALMNHMDKITIGASAAICATVLLAVIIFIGITKRSKTKRPNSHMTKIPPSMMTPSPGSAMITPGPFNISKEWDQMSVISTKSIPRARVYHGSMDGLANPNITAPRATMIAPHVHRHIPDGNSAHRSYLSTHHHHHNHSMHAYTNGHSHIHHNANATSAVSSYLNNQGRLLRTSLGSRASYDALNKMTSSGHSHRQFEQNNKRRRPGRLSQSESLNTLNGYETPDNWTDHDMDFYVARNPTRHDLVQL